MAPTNAGSSAPPQIPGAQIPDEFAVELKEVVAGLLERENLRFPGAQPVSFAREHIAELQRQEYFMCEKTDGIRCLLFLHWRDNGQEMVPVSILIDRKNHYYEITPPIRFPYHESPDNDAQFLFGTILDGELVYDTYPDGQRKLIYYVFDCLAVDNQNLAARSLDKRLGYMQERLFKPWRKHLERTRRPPQQTPFQVKEKQVYSPYHVSTMFDKVLPELKHGNDGLIFTCKATRYTFGTDNHILKWKPPHENSIDFKLRVTEFPLFDPEDGEDGLIPDYDAKPRFQLVVNHGRQDYRPFAHDLYVTDQEWDMFKALNQRLDGRIIECYREDTGQWRFKKEDDGTPRWRDDKTEANHISTVNSVLESIENPVTEHDLRISEPRIKESVTRMRREDEDTRRRAERAQHEQMENSKKRKFSEGNGA